MGNTQFPKQLSQQQIQKIYSRFQEIEQDKSGKLDVKEIFNSQQVQSLLVKRLIKILGNSNDGTILFGQFLSALATLYGPDRQKKLQFAFRIYDIDDDGYITNGQIFTIFRIMANNNMNDLQIQQLADRTIIEADLNYDGKISYPQFKNIIKDLQIGGKLII